MLLFTSKNLFKSFILLMIYFYYTHINFLEKCQNHILNVVDWISDQIFIVNNTHTQWGVFRFGILCEAVQWCESSWFLAGEFKGRDQSSGREKRREGERYVFVLTENVCRQAQSCHSGGCIDCQWSPRSLTRQRHLNLRAGQRHLRA